MGNTFGERNEVSHLIRVRDHLKFVMDNWHMNNSAFKNKSNIKYIITAFNQEEKHEEEGPLQELTSYVKGETKRSNEAMKDISEEILRTQRMIERLEERVE